MNIYGASGHSKVIIDIAKSNNILIENIIDDDLSVNEILGYSVKHKVDEELLASKTILGIGNNSIRKRVSELFKGAIHQAIFHHSAVVSPFAIIDCGTVIMPNASINANAEIGKHCIINTGAIVEHDCVLEDFVHISPNSSLAGGVKIGEGTHVGIGASVIQGISIGKWVTIGAGAVIIKDIPDNAVVVGNPGRIIKYIE
ncbi:acetyltransferase [Gillisia sp. M10.2A]|uniref:Acetyltransferase n=1 Tax=Gillisia lutea TaxID=2909668 RepID=A0ABS9EIJ1_9FLAO|nr:acetyltransferase [Gillisia lutea]MCF4102680.1 acetyltransferase [Gillisia lutea]